MANERRLSLQMKFEELLRSRNVYYQTPESVKMQYDAIRYSLGVPETRYANDKRYNYLTCYDVIVISRDPDPEVVGKILEMPYSSMSGKPYVADGLNHYPIKLYY